MIDMAAKKTKRFKFVVPNFGFKNTKKVKERWRRQRGIDNKLRIEKKGSGRLPKIGYKKSDSIRHRLRSGLLEAVVHNEQELLALKGDEGHMIRFAHELSRKKRIELKKIADANRIKLRFIT